MTGPFVCPVCGFPGLSEEPYTPDGGGSYEICPCCRFEYGVTDDDRGETFDSWRARWIGDGMPWRSRATFQPAGWDAAAQLAALGPGT